MAVPVDRKDQFLLSPFFLCASSITGKKEGIGWKGGRNVSDRASRVAPGDLFRFGKSLNLRKKSDDFPTTFSFPR